MNNILHIYKIQNNLKLRNPSLIFASFENANNKSLTETKKQFL